MGEHRTEVKGGGLDCIASDRMRLVLARFSDSHRVLPVPGMLGFMEEPQTKTQIEEGIP
jgi:hypothetical protein